jgi:hypothetical protein
MIWGPAFVATSAALWSFFLLAGSGCGYNGAMCPDACVRVESHLRTHIVGQARVEAVASHASLPLTAVRPLRTWRWHSLLRQSATMLSTCAPSRRMRASALS